MPTYATAADLPPELFPLILQHLTDDDQGREYSRRSTKYDLSAVSLTCRFWAERCRPHLFRSLNLQTKEHLYEFSELLDQASHALQEVTPLTVHLQTLLVIPLEGGPPWIHLVFSVLRYKLPDHVSIFLGLEATRFVPRHNHPVHSIHHSLPKSMAAFYSQYHSLYLADVHFRDVMDFVRLVNELRTLRQLRCNRLTWDKSVHSEEVWRRMRQPKCLEHVQADDCTDNWVFLGLLAKRSFTVVENTLRARTKNQDYLLSRSDLQCASEIVAACQGVSRRDSGLTSSSVSIDATWWNTYSGYGESLFSSTRREVGSDLT
ncbi:hypothetical protein BDY19DRAFT_741680 [Irpex rosettiformis]|uniref:Uncharacterized protein n=1 Tax=Irpex rosettiformis TaxID=378272 RepID=A0ACB8U9F1_9APHY|nr:hypothetical protein BDY19DRAFT_741680 [Irpex rosettiformis]